MSAVAQSGPGALDRANGRRRVSATAAKRAPPLHVLASPTPSSHFLGGRLIRRLIFHHFADHSGRVLSLCLPTLHAACMRRELDEGSNIELSLVRQTPQSQSATSSTRTASYNIPSAGFFPLARLTHISCASLTAATHCSAILPCNWRHYQFSTPSPAGECKHHFPPAADLAPRYYLHLSLPARSPAF